MQPESAQRRPAPDVRLGASTGCTDTTVAEFTETVRSTRDLTAHLAAQGADGKADHDA